MSRYTGARILRREGAATVKGIREDCRTARRAITEDARARREELREAIRAERVALRGSCSLRLDEARARVAAAVLEAQHTHADLAKLRAVTRTPAQRSGAERARLQRSLNIQESDDQVRRQLPSSLHLAWEKRKRLTKKSARRSRLEAFLEWVQEHAGEVARWNDEEAARGYAEESEDEFNARRRAADVPF